MKVAVKHVALCPKRDLMALANAGDGSLSVYRFSPADAINFFECLVPPPDGSTNPRSDPPPAAAVSSLCWAPDGKTLAAGYADGSLFLEHCDPGALWPHRRFRAARLPRRASRASLRAPFGLRSRGRRFRLNAISEAGAPGTSCCGRTRP